MKLIIFLFEAPEGCGQYFTSDSGEVKGLNFDADENNNQYLSGLNYAISIRRELDTCSVSHEIS